MTDPVTRADLNALRSEIIADLREEFGGKLDDMKGDSATLDKAVGIVTDRVARFQDRLDAEPSIEVIRDRAKNDRADLPWPISWINAVAGGWFERLLGEKAREAVGLLGRILLYALVVFGAYLLHDAWEWYKAKEDVQTGAQVRGANAEGRAADALQDMAEPPLDFGPDSTDYPDDPYPEDLP